MRPVASSPSAASSDSSLDSAVPDIVTAAHITATAAAARHPDDDWVCHVCGNFNRAMRERCNMNVCAAPLGFPGPYSGALSSAGLVPKTAPAADTPTADSDSSAATATSPDRCSEKSTSTDVAPVAFALTETTAGPLSSLGVSMSMDSAVSPPLTSLAAAGPRRFDAAASALSTPSHRSDAVPCIPPVEEFVFDVTQASDLHGESVDTAVMSVSAALLLEGHGAKAATDHAPVSGVGQDEDRRSAGLSHLPTPPTPLDPSPCAPPVASKATVGDMQPPQSQPTQPVQAGRPAPSTLPPMLPLAAAGAGLPTPLAPMRTPHLCRSTMAGLSMMGLPSGSVSCALSMPQAPTAAAAVQPYGAFCTPTPQHHPVNSQPMMLPARSAVPSAQPLMHALPPSPQYLPLQQQLPPTHHQLQRSGVPQVPPSPYVVQHAGFVYTLPPFA